MPKLSKKQRRKIKKMKRRGASPLEVQAKREKMRAKRGMTQVQPGETPATPQAAGEWAGQKALEQAIQSSTLGAPKQRDIYGNIYDVQIDPETGQPTITQTLAAPEQQALEAQRAYQAQLRGMGATAMGQAGQAMAQPYGYGGISPVMGQEDMMAERQRIEDEYYNRQARMMEPQFQKEMESFEQMAAERGWVPGSEVYQAEKSRLEEGQGRQREQWASGAATAGLAEMQGQYGLSAQERARQLGEYEKLRYQPFQEAQQFMGLAGGPQVGPFQQARFGQVAPINFGQMATSYAGLMQAPWTLGQQQAHQMEMLRQQQAMRGGGPAPLTPEQKIQYDIEHQARMKELGLGQYYMPQQPGTDWAGVAGGLAGPLLEGWAAGGFQNPFGGGR